MIGVIPNPKKEITIPRSISEVRPAIEGINFLEPKYKVYKKDDVLNLYVFEATEFLSVGVFIDVSLKKISEDTSEVCVEISRKIGTFNQSHEVSLANGHISKIFSLISEGIQKPELIMQQKNDAEKAKEELQNKLKNNEKKRQEQRLNSPFLFYSKEIFSWLIIAAIALAFLYFGYIIFTS